MTARPPPIPPLNDEELHAFIDGELPPDRALELDAAIAADPALSARVAAFRADTQLIGRVFGAMPDRPLPAEWLRTIAEHRRPRTALRPRYGMALAALAAGLVLLVGGGVAYRALIQPASDPIIAEALAARQDETLPERDIVAGPTSAKPALDHALAQALDANLKVPDLARMGYSLASIRIYAAARGTGGKAAELSYRNGEGRLFTLYVRRPTGPPRVDLINRGGLRICIWQDDVMGAVMLGQMSAAEMARLASLAYAGMN
jgi:anti-sigma factor RsiW